MSLTNVNTAVATGTSKVDIVVTSAAGNDRSVIAVATQSRSPVNITSATLNGVAATNVVITATQGVHRVVTFQWLDADMPASAGTYEIDTNGLPDAGGAQTISGYSADGFAQSAASDSGVIEQASGTGGTITLSSAGSGALLIGGLTREAGTGTIASGSGQTDILADFSTGSDRHISSFNTDDNTHQYTSTSTQETAMAAASFDLVAAGGPALTAPATITDGTSSTWTGTDLDTLASTGDVFLKETAIVASSKLQTYGTVTATTIPDVVNDIGQDELRDAGTSPVAGIAVTADIEAAGATTAVHLLSVDDGTNPEATFSTVITTETSIQTVQTMAAVAETGSGNGFFGSNLTVAENNQQCSLPKIVNSVTSTLSASGDGTFTVLKTELDAAGGSITFDALYYSPTTKNWSKIALTLTEAGLSTGGITRSITRAITRPITRSIAR